jgi:hypothetical protein
VLPLVRDEDVEPTCDICGRTQDEVEDEDLVLGLGRDVRRGMGIPDAVVCARSARSNMRRESKQACCAETGGKLGGCCLYGIVTPPVLLNEEKGSHHRVYPFHHTFSVCWTLSGFMMTLGGKPFL